MLQTCGLGSSQWASWQSRVFLPSGPRIGLFRTNRPLSGRAITEFARNSPSTRNQTFDEFLGTDGALLHPGMARRARLLAQTSASAHCFSVEFIYIHLFYLSIHLSIFLSIYLYIYILPLLPMTGHSENVRTRRFVPWYRGTLAHYQPPPPGTLRYDHA